MSSNDRVLRKAGEPEIRPGRFGQALDGDGHHYAAVGDVANFGFFDKFSVSAWIKPKGEQGGTIISRMTDVPHGDGWCVVLDHGKLQVHLTKRWLDDACRVELADPIPADEWSHFTVTYDGSREVAGIHIDIDGIRRQTITLLDELNQSFDNKGPLRIGAGNGADGRFYGLIDDVRVFDRVLSDEESRILAQSDRLSAIAAIPRGKAHAVAERRRCPIISCRTRPDADSRGLGTIPIGARCHRRIHGRIADHDDHGRFDAARDVRPSSR